MRTASIVTWMSVLGLAMLSEAPAATQPKDCVRLQNGEGATVYEGRYDILCIHPDPGPLALSCAATRVPGPSFLAVHPYRVAGAGPQRVTVADGLQLMLSGHVDADGADEARVFFSYDGPFNPIKDRYTLTCR